MAAQIFSCLSSEWLDDPQRQRFGLDAQVRAFFQSQRRVCYTVIRRCERVLVCVRLPNKNRVRGRRLCVSGKRAIQVISEEDGFASLSRDDTIAIRAAPAAAVRAS